MTLACICYDDNGDIRLLINHGIFLSVAECNGYITSNGLDKKLFKPYELKVNESSLLNNLETNNSAKEYQRVTNAAIFDLVERILSNPLLEDQSEEYCTKRAIERVVNYYPISYSLAEPIVRKIVEGHYI